MDSVLIRTMIRMLKIRRRRQVRNRATLSLWSMKSKTIDVKKSPIERIETVRPKVLVMFTT